MSDINNLLALVNAQITNLDLTTNTPVVASLKVGGMTNSELTKAILDNLIALQNGSDLSTGTNAHTHDGRYFTETELGSVLMASGATKIGVFGTPSFFTPTAQTVQGFLEGIDSALSGVGGSVFLDSVFRIVDDGDGTKRLAFQIAGVSPSTTRLITMPDFDVNLGALTNNNIDAAAAIAYSKLNLLASIVNADVASGAAIAYAKLNLLGSIVNADIATGAAIAYAKLALSNSIVNADIASGAAIAYSKLNLSGSIVNADVAANAAIAYTKLATLTGNRALASNSSGFIVASPVTDTELGYVSGVTSSIQTQLNNKVSTADVGVPNGVASLDGNGKVPVTQLPNSVMEYQESWDPSTNTPALADGVGNAGDVYRVSADYASAVSGLTDPSMIDFHTGDLVIYSGVLSKFQRCPVADGVVSVNGMQGAVTVNAINELTGDVAAGPASGSETKVATIQPASVTGTKIAANTITNNNINSAAGIVYSKLNLSASIVNADVASGAAIAYAKLNLSGSLVNADVATGAAIDYSKLNLLASIINADIAAGAAIDYSKLFLTGSVVNADLAANTVTFAKIQQIATNKLLGRSTAGTGDIEVLSVGTGLSLSGGTLSATGTGGTVTSVSVTSANGFAGSVATATSTPAITISTTVTGLLKGDGTAISAASAGVDYQAAGNYITDLSGDVVATGPGSATATIQSASVTGAKIASDTITNANINSAAGIVYTKLNLSASIVNADVATNAAIAYSKLNLSGSIVNADIASGAAIAYSKLALSNSITASDLTTGAFDQVTITGGNGSAAAVVATPSVKLAEIAGEAYAANTSFVVRYALNGETAGRVYKADKDASSLNKYNGFGMIEGNGAAAKSAGNSVVVVVDGTLTLGSSDATFSAADLGQAVYLTATGGFSTTPPSTTNEAVYVIGVVKNTTQITINAKQLRYIN